MPDSTVHHLALREYEFCENSTEAELLSRGSIDAYLDKSRGWLERGLYDGKPAIRATDHVGLLPFTADAQPHLLFVAPKGSRQNEKDGLLRFMELVALSEGETLAETEPAGFEGVRGPELFLLLLARHYARLLAELCRRDFRSYYRSEEGHLRGFIRGRLDMAGYARLAAQGRAHILPCRWEEFTVDNWDNRILWAAARRMKAAAAAIDRDAARLLWEPFQHLLSWFAPVADFPISTVDFHRSRLGRISGYYRRALAWAKLLLQGSDLPAAGGRAPAVVLQAHKIFQKFAEIIAQECLPETWHYEFEPNTRFKFLAGGEPGSVRYPDIFLFRPEGARAVGDAKYKEVLEHASETNLENPEEVYKASIQPADWNQLYVYMRFKRASAGFFVVPFWNALGKPVHLNTHPQFEISPLDGGSPVRLAVLGLNLLRKPLREVKTEAVNELRGWLLL